MVARLGIMRFSICMSGVWDEVLPMGSVCEQKSQLSSGISDRYHATI